MSLIFATQLTAVATTILAVFAIVTAVYAIRAFRKQSQEVSEQAKLLGVQSEQLNEQRKINAEQTKVLQLQATELRESLNERIRDTAERHRAQASRVFMWTELKVPRDLTKAYQQGVIAYIKNTSEQPVYDVRISWRKGSAPWGEPDHILVLRPGEQQDWMRTTFLRNDVDKSLFGAVAFFRDTAGITWRTRPDGQLDEIPAGQEPPHTW